jgi:hypothetical protein
MPLSESPSIVDRVVTVSGFTREETIERLVDLLLAMHAALAKSGVTHINDPRISDDVTSLWRVLSSNPEIAFAIPSDSLGSLLAFVE